MRQFEQLWTNLAWVPYAAALGIGLSVGLIGWWFAQSVANVPDEDRTYRDRPPPMFRALWLPIQWLAYYLGAIMPIATRQRAIVQLRLAGLDYSLSPEQFMAARVVCCILTALFLWFVLNAFRVPMTLTLWSVAVALCLFGYFFPAIWLRDQVQLRRRQTLKTLPFFLDIITLCVEGGLNLTGAFQQAVAKGPAGPLRDELARVLRDMRAGKARADALRTFADRMNEPVIANFVSAVIQAEAMGSSLGPVLRAQSEQRRTERFARAEKLAMEAPVKMLFPLIAFIFPCTFMVLAFPIVQKFMHSGM
jgi:tight adherence protein C